ncbi:MAG: glycosyl transferase family 1 [Chloroflexi bacterium RBG_13_56_8]|nr:MAG: glycosyl transferase family 1 [Chloroflexi bacterium RBG_13_56_8]
MRVTMISKACIVGTYQAKLEAIASHKDIDLTVVVPHYWRENGNTLTLERTHTEGYQLLPAPVAFNGKFHLHFYPTLPSILRQSKPDLCHIDEEPYNLATYLALRAARRVKARTLFFTWQNLSRRYPPPFRNIESYIYSHADAAIAGNLEAEQVLRGKGYTGPVRVIPQFGVDPTLFHPKAQDLPRDVFTIGYAGRLVEQKGIMTLLAAVEHLSGSWRLLIYGDGPIREQLSSRVTALGLGDKVQLNARVPFEQMPQRFAELDVLVLPSLTKPNWKEQFGRVLIEAMACEVPVIGSDSGEIPNVIGEAGKVFPEGDAYGLRDLLSLLRDQTPLRRELGAKGRQRVLAHYTQTHIAEETVAFYRAVCEPFSH